MRIGRTLPPAAVPIGWKSFFSGLAAVLRGTSEIDRFKYEARGYFGVRHCFVVSSGKAALTLILLALKQRHPERDEVLIPAFTCYSVPSAIVRAGLKVKLCDTTADGFDFDHEQLQPLLDSKKLLCVVPTHLLGLPADVQRLRGMITDPDIAIVEDAAQAMGGAWQGHKLGTLGDVGFFSLGRGKALSTVAGGIILTDNDPLADLLKQQYEQLPTSSLTETFKLIGYAAALNILMHPDLFWLPKSLPFLKLGETLFDPNFSIGKLSAFQAGLSRGWTEKLPALQAGRAAHVRRWQMIGQDTVTKPFSADPLPLLRFPVLPEDAKTATDILHQGQHLGIAASYPDAVHRIPELAAEFKGQDYPAAVSVAQRLVTLPVHGYVNEEDHKKISALLTAVSHCQGIPDR